MEETQWQSFLRTVKRELKHGRPRFSFWITVACLVSFAVVMIGEAVIAKKLERRLQALLIAAAFGLPAYLLARWLVAPDAPDPEGTHNVMIDFVRQEGDDSYFVATCKCGWVGDVVATEAESRADASNHSPCVQAEVGYPLGQ